MALTAIYNFGMTNGAEIMGSTGVIFSIIIWMFAFFLLWYAVGLPLGPGVPSR